MSIKEEKEKLEEARLYNRYLGLKVFKDDPRLLNEVSYNGCETYVLKRGPVTSHFYTELTTKSTFAILTVPTAHEVRRKIIEVRQRFEEVSNG